MLRENVCQRASSLSLSASALSGISLLHLQRHISTQDAVNGAGIKIRTRRSSNSEVKRKREKKTQKMQTKAGSPHGKCTPSAARSHLVTRHTSSHSFFFFSLCNFRRSQNSLEQTEKKTKKKQTNNKETRSLEEFRSYEHL